ncbi:MAG: DNA repair protein RecN [Burkholderiales bacterium]|nr:DNA repair protein RecN [Burkholderiales bacterium]
MLRHLSIRDFVIVERLELDLAAGFTVLTGETGAGKSILVDALALVLGGRGDADVVRPGAKQAEIGVEFQAPPATLLEWLARHGLEGDDGSCLLRRVIEAGGRSRGFINGRAATLTQLREAGEFLLDIHGQHAHQSLVRADAQRSVLDAHGGLESVVARVRAAWSHLRQCRDALAEAREHADRLGAERERIDFALEELDRLAPATGEWETVEREHTRLSHAATLLAGAQAALGELQDDDGALLGRLAGVVARLQGLRDIDAGLGEAVTALEPASIHIQEAARELSQYLRRADLDPARLAAVSSRLEVLHGAARRAKVAPGMLPAEHARLRARREELRLAADLEALARREAEALAAWTTAAATLSAGRAKAAKSFGRAVTAAMQTLAMSGGRLEVALEPAEGPGPHGAERVEFLIAAHAGTPPRPLGKVASGGELSRIGLAIQVIASRAALVPTLVFDEVDSGIGGAVAATVGRLLGELGQEHQVLCVTHLAQVAARAGTQWQVTKASAGGAPVSSLKVLSTAERVDEIARMLGGTPITPTTRKAARELLAA